MEVDDYIVHTARRPRYIPRFRGLFVGTDMRCPSTNIPPLKHHSCHNTHTNMIIRWSYVACGIVPLWLCYIKLCLSVLASHRAARRKAAAAGKPRMHVYRLPTPGVSSEFIVRGCSWCGTQITHPRRIRTARCFGRARTNMYRDSVMCWALGQRVLRVGA